jgi:hypothetical protein
VGLFPVLLSCAASRETFFDIISGSAKKFPFGLLRELTGKALICLVVFGAGVALFGNKRKIPGSTGITGNSAPAALWVR